MSDAVIGIVVGVSVFLVTNLVNSLVKRADIKTKTDVMSDNIEQIKKEQKIILQVLLPVVLSVKGQKPNGELTRALELLDNYLINK